MSLTDAEASLLQRTARGVARKWPNVSADDVHQDLWVWALSPVNLRWVREYRTDPHGWQKLQRAVWRAGLKAAEKEEQQVTGRVKLRERDDSLPWSVEAVKALLPIMWSREDWPQPVVGTRDGPDPDRVTDVLAMLIDLSAVVNGLTKREQACLYYRYSEECTSAEVADMMGLTEAVVAKATQRATQKVVRALVGQG